MKPREQALLGHYAKHLNYYSLFTSEPNFKKACAWLDVEWERLCTVLDIGCGTGPASWLASYTDYFGIDYSPERIREAWKRPIGFFTVADVNTFFDNIPDDRFDLGIIFETLEHLEDPAAVIAEAKRCCLTIIGSVPINMPYEAHLQVYKTPSEVEKQLSPNKIIAKDGHFLLRWG